MNASYIVKLLALIFCVRETVLILSLDEGISGGECDGPPVIVAMGKPGRRELDGIEEA